MIRDMTHVTVIRDMTHVITDMAHVCTVAEQIRHVPRPG